MSYVIQELRDDHNHTFAKIYDNGDYLEIRDDHNHACGRYYKKDDVTRDDHNRTVGKGNQLALLVKR